LETDSKNPKIFVHCDEESGIESDNTSNDNNKNFSVDNKLNVEQNVVVDHIQVDLENVTNVNTKQDVSCLTKVDNSEIDVESSKKTCPEKSKCAGTCKASKKEDKFSDELKNIYRENVTSPNNLVIQVYHKGEITRKKSEEEMKFGNDFHIMSERVSFSKTVCSDCDSISNYQGDARMSFESFEFPRKASKVTNLLLLSDNNFPRFVILFITFDLFFFFNVVY